jgi:hypothetical protein
MPIVIVDNFDVNVAKNIDSRYGPYATVAQATGSISSIFRYKGLTVLITGSGENVEYWFDPTTADTDLVPKTATVNTGSLLTTASFNSWTGSSTSQFAGTASYASNGGVTQLLQGTNIVLSPNPGVGSVTISAIAAGAGSGIGQNATSSFANSTTWTFTHGLGTRYPVIQALDANHNQIIPEKIELVDDNTAQITFPTQETGYAIATVGGATASYLRVLNQDLIISGNIIPAGPYTSNTSSYDLGSPTKAWRDIYVSNGSIKMISGSNSASIQFNNGAVTFTGAAVTLPSSSTTPTASYVTPYEGAWTSYTPAWTAASSNPSIGNGSLQGWYKVVGKTCFVRGNIVMGSTTTFGSGEWYVSMPFTASHADAILMTANLLDNGTAWYNATLNGARAGFNHKTAIQYQGGAGTALDVNATQPHTWASTDRFLWNGSYEIA